MLYFAGCCWYSFACISSSHGKKDRPPTKSETIRSMLAENEPQSVGMGVPEYAMMSRALFTPSLGKAPPKPRVSPPDEISDTSYGADISTLIAMLENGEL